MVLYYAIGGKPEAKLEVLAGLTGKDADETIENIWRPGKDGMKETDIRILKLMVGDKKE